MSSTLPPQANSCTPTKVGEDLGRIVEVAATHYNHISAALTQDSRWGPGVTEGEVHRKN